VLFVVGQGLGFRTQSDLTDVDWVESLGNVFTPRFDFDGLTGRCVDAEARTLVVQPDGACEVSIAPVSSGTRRVALRLERGARVEARYVAPADHEKIDERDESASQTVVLEGDRQPSVVILKEGGTLSLSCTSADESPCRIVVT
jgi:hypothetical protein